MKRNHLPNGHADVVGSHLQHWSSRYSDTECCEKDQEKERTRKKTHLTITSTVLRQKTRKPLVFNNSSLSLVKFEIGQCADAQCATFRMLNAFSFCLQLRLKFEGTSGQSACASPVTPYPPQVHCLLLQLTRRPNKPLRCYADQCCWKRQQQHRLAASFGLIGSVGIGRSLRKHVVDL